jgi:hypothetical protein
MRTFSWENVRALIGNDSNPAPGEGKSDPRLDKPDEEQAVRSRLSLYQYKENRRREEEQNLRVLNNNQGGLKNNHGPS